MQIEEQGCWDAVSGAFGARSPSPQTGCGMEGKPGCVDGGHGHGRGALHGPDETARRSHPVHAHGRSGRDVYLPSAPLRDHGQEAQAQAPRKESGQSLLGRAVSLTLD